jgi:hypothetical protein
MNKYDRHAEREWREQMKEQFYAWDTPPKPRIPRVENYEATIRLMLGILAVLSVCVGGIVWVLI